MMTVIAAPDPAASVPSAPVQSPSAGLTAAGRGHVLTLSCLDRPGLVAAVAGLLARHGGNILEAQQFDDLLTRRFFMRVVFDLVQPAGLARLLAEFPAAVVADALNWRVRPRTQRRRVLLMVSRQDHCLGDLLYRHRLGELNMDVVGIVSNHPRDALHISLIGDIPFHHLPVQPGRKAEQEALVRRLIIDTGTELVILARYMQVLSDGFAAWLEGRCINIHHGFLPGFKGARPYQQAYERGVKMIGATAHYVTGDLDEGPIIAQDVEQITHADGPEELARKGRDIERRVLARAVRCHLEDRVLMNGRSTIVF